MAKVAINFRKFSLEDRLDLIEQIWDSLSGEERDSLPLSAGQARELDQRLEALEKEGVSGITPEQLRERLSRRV